MTEFAKLAEAYKMELDQVKAYIAAEDLKKDIAVGKTVDFIKEQAILSNIYPQTLYINVDVLTSLNGGFL